MSNVIPPQVSLRAFREWRGLTLPQLAAEIHRYGVDISVSQLNNAELGHKNPGPELLDAWAKALGIGLEHIRIKRDLIRYLERVQAADEDALQLEAVA